MPPLLARWQRAGGEYFSRRRESIASTSPKSGRDARRVCHDFSPLSFVFAARPFCFYPMLYHIREGGELKADTPRT